MHPKFIIENSPDEGLNLIIGLVEFHKELAHNKNHIKGGGMWTKSYDKKTIILSGKSYDFGPANFDDIKYCIQNKKVFTSYILENNIADEFQFQYVNEIGERINL